MSSARALTPIAFCIAFAASLAGCASGEAAPRATRAPARSASRPSAPPNAVMLDYMSPDELAHTKQMEQEAAARPPGTIGEKDPPPRIRQTIVIGRNNPDPVWEMDHPQPAYDEPGQQARGFSDPPTYRSGPVFYYRGGGGGGGGGSQGSPAAPRVGGDWPSAPSYGPKQMR